MLSYLLSLVMVTLLSLVFLYSCLNDKKLRRLPRETELAFSPTRLTPQDARATAESLSKNPIVIKDVLPLKTGRRYIIVGGAGFLGGWIVLQLLERGEDPRKIRIVDIRPPSRPDLRTGAAQQVAFLQVDISDAAAMSTAFKIPWPDAEGEQEVTVFHTAANVHFYERHAGLLYRSLGVNYDGTLNVINACKEIGANTLIYTSSASLSVRCSRFWLWPWEKQPEFFVQVYNDDDIHPSRHWQQDCLFSNYAISKFAAEKAVCAADNAPTKGSRTLRTGCIRPGNAIFGPAGDMICGAYLVRKHNPTWILNILQSFIYVENCALSHLCYEQRLIELEQGSRNPDVGGRAFIVTDAGPPITYNDLYTTLNALDEDIVFPILSPTLMLGLAYVIEACYVTKLLLSRSSIGRAVAKLIPTVSGDIVNLQPSMFSLMSIHLILDDSRARLPPADGGLGYNAPYTTLQGICKTAEERFKSANSKEEERSLSGGAGYGFKSKKAKGTRRVVNAVGELLDTSPLLP